MLSNEHFLDVRQKMFWGALDPYGRVSGAVVGGGVGGEESSSDLAEKALWRWAKAEGGHQLQTLPSKGAHVRQRGKLLCQRLTAHRPTLTHHSWK